ncbi:hypothetical protein BSZ39_05830 [Bowdeniella nasicola]|uniref:DUF7455 domain-containing protein n=1 Tax=Bowdeniella nasicola TaxID=208480 RepID=A0A1Q5Q2R2_9ACTO|nr:hypothetical protein [Bowdeniella nasicola]OKL54133.1 hypothetical protein BSZ39_05830 [Bowdeniella nasicola]
MTTAPSKELEPMTSADRCDACGARAYLHVGLETGELYFCGHHARTFADSLADRAVIIRDETSKLAGADA